MTLVLEIQTPDAAGWTEMGRLAPGDPPGSLSNHTETGRDLIQFRCLHTGAIIERSLGGVDEEITRELRAVTTVGMEQLVLLTGSETYEMQLRTDRMPRPTPFRFRHEPNRVQLGPGIYAAGGEMHIDEEEFIIASGGDPHSPADRKTARRAIARVCAENGIPYAEREP